MEGRGIAWLGVRTEQFEKMRRLYEDVLQLAPFQVDATSARFRLENGTEIHVYGPQDEDHEFLGMCPVVGLLVEDVETVRQRMESAGIAFIGPIQSDGRSRWSHFRGPDGNVYEIISRSGA